MKKAAEEENWDEVTKILKDHLKIYKREGYKHHISNVGTRINTYDQALANVHVIMSDWIAEKKPPIGGDITMLQVQIDQAINAAAMFERTLKFLISKERFLR